MRKFIIIGMPRTGSTLVQTTLEQHPKIRALGELFHWVQTEREGAHAIVTPAGKRFFDPDTEDPIAFLDEAVWAAQTDEIQATGFKLFAEHVEAESTRDLFPRLKAAWPDLSVIYIDRRNMLDVLVSRHMALKTGEWVRRAEHQQIARQDTLHISPQDAQEFFEKHVEMTAMLDQWSQDMRRLRIEYEDLNNDFSRISRSMFEFLGVQSLDVGPAITKQLDRPPEQVVENWGELLNHFRGTDYEHLFARNGGARSSARESRVSNKPGKAEAANPSPIAEAAAPITTSTRSRGDQMSKLSIPPLNYDDRFARPNIFREVFGALSDAEWREVLLRSIHQPEINGISFPGFPDSDLQSRIHGSTGEAAMDDAIRFFLFVKDRVGEKYLRPSSRFLDFGSGWGRILRPYMRYFDLSNIYAFEPNRMLVTIARSLNPHVTFLSGEYLPNRRIPRHMFDLIVGYSVFSHLSHRSATSWLREISELLNAGGVAVFTTWGKRFIDQLSTEKARLDAGEEIHWYHRFLLEKVGNPDVMREHYDAGKYIWIKSLQDADYGDTLLSQIALQRILTENILPLEVVAFDTTSLPQDAFILRRL